MEQQMPAIKAIALSVGGTPDPLIKSIEHHRPEFVCFLASQGTNHVTIKVRDLLGSRAGDIRFATELVDDENDLLECHRKAEKAIARIQTDGYAKDQVVVDYTGGTKNMSVALALAAIEKGYLFSYVGGSRRSKDGVGVVESGHEQIHTHVNPWDFMAVREKRQAAQFFNSCQFKACRDVLARLAENASTRKSVFRKLALVADAFHNWDLFRHIDARELCRKARLEELAEDHESWIARFAVNCLAMLPVLEKIIFSSAKGKKPSLELALDLYANAERRFAEGKVDDAVLRLYRLVEMLAQLQLLAGHGIDVSDVRPEQLPEALRDEYLAQYRNQRTGLVQLPQTPSFRLLRELGDPLGKAFATDAGRFKDVQKARNDSYLAHGFLSSKEATYEKLRDFVVDLGALKTASAPQFPRME
ncbi:MAG TPA: TIGR02710 family CRISPR-associated protein [Desulfobacteraceae bacterium]|nr:TIGR02710 family CRISPR-associated protein [Desulfobacteraceae bacterium]